MNFTKKEIPTIGIKLIAEENGQEIGRARLYLIHNDLHDQPYGLMEDVFVDEAHRGGGIGTDLIEAVIVEAKARECYKLVATSRTERVKVHELYERLGFKNYGIEFRIDF